MKNMKSQHRSILVNAGQRHFDRGQNAAKRHPNCGPKCGQRGQGDGDVIADVTGSVSGSGSESGQNARVLTAQNASFCLGINTLFWAKIRSFVK